MAARGDDRSIFQDVSKKGRIPPQRESIMQKTTVSQWIPILQLKPVNGECCNLRLHWYPFSFRRSLAHAIESNVATFQSQKAD
jgi:hypothetical protein